MTTTAIIIPARYASTRFPGKPLALLGGKSMLARVYDHAYEAAQGLSNVTLSVATDDERIADHCRDNGMDFVFTSPDCLTGSDRVMEAANQLGTRPDFIINLQGDAPFTPPDFIRAMLDDFLSNPDIDVITPVTRLNWDALDKLRKNKLTTPFSGTTAVIDSQRNALWFSKNIIPAIRKEESLRDKDSVSPVYRHIGLYGYSYHALQKFVSLPEGIYEKLEGLEQLRFLENGMHIRAVIVDYKGRPSMSGIDSPEDLARAEELLRQHA
jgi:3-deoxy-manno-octulosonate cytidylyltransferase (CMP-KDO synthetase)